MIPWQQHVLKGWQRDMGAGIVGAGTALVASFLYRLASTVFSLRLSSTAQYWAGYAPQFALVAGLVVGTVVWRRAMSPTSTPKRGALAGLAMALGIIVLVPVLAGGYVMLFPLLLSVVTGQGVSSALSLYPAPLWTAVSIARVIAVAWSPLVGVLLVPLGALAGWAYQRSRRPSGR